MGRVGTRRNRRLSGIPLRRPVRLEQDGRYCVSNSGVCAALIAEGLLGQSAGAPPPDGEYSLLLLERVVSRLGDDRNTTFSDLFCKPTWRILRELNQPNSVFHGLRTPGVWQQFLHEAGRLVPQLREHEYTRSLFPAPNDPHSCPEED